jgi:hypothetical protein
MTDPMGSLTTTGAERLGALRSSASAVTRNCRGLIRQSDINAVQEQPVTAVFVMSHHWRVDVLTVKRQHAAWIGAI